MALKLLFLLEAAISKKVLLGRRLDGPRVQRFLGSALLAAHRPRTHVTVHLLHVGRVWLASTLTIIEHVLEGIRPVQLVDRARSAAARVMLKLLWRLRRHGRHLSLRSHGSNRVLLMLEYRVLSAPLVRQRRLQVLRLVLLRESLQHGPLAGHRIRSGFVNLTGARLGTLILGLYGHLLALLRDQAVVLVLVVELGRALVGCDLSHLLHAATLHLGLSQRAALLLGQASGRANLGTTIASLHKRVALAWTLSVLFRTIFSLAVISGVLLLG